MIRSSKTINVYELDEGISLRTRHDGLSESRIKLHVSEWDLKHPNFQNRASNISADLIYSDTHIALDSLVVEKKVLAESIFIDLSKMPDRIPFQAVIYPVSGRLEASAIFYENRLR